MSKTYLIGCIVVLAISLMIISREGSAENRIALVIGNGAYEDARLDNPQREAALMANTLRNLGFDVLIDTDVDQRGMRRLIRNFGDRLKDASDTIAFFYFSGHGMRVNGRNYMIPVDAVIDDESDVEVDGVLAWSVLSRMEYANSAMNIVVLDACRNNPYEKRFRSPQEDVGLAPMQAPAGTLIAYATAPGDVADAGPKGGYSPFTAALANELGVSTAPVWQLFNNVSIRVYEETGRKQRPYVESSVVPLLALRQRPQAPANLPPAPVAPERALVLQGGGGDNFASKRAEWSSIYLRHPYADTYHVIVASITSGNRNDGLRVLRDFCVKFPQVNFQLDISVAADGVSNRIPALYAGKGISRSVALDLVQRVRSMQIADDAFMLHQPWDGNPEFIADCNNIDTIFVQD